MVARTHRDDRWAGCPPAELAEFLAAQPLAMQDIPRTVLTRTGPQTVLELLRRRPGRRVVRESGMRATATHVVQLVELSGAGIRLRRWPFLS